MDALAQDDSATAVDLALVRSHRFPRSQFFYAYGLETLAEFGGSDAGSRLSLGIPLRAGFLSSPRLSGQPLAKGTYFYGQVTPLVTRNGAGSMAVGTRFSLGVTSPGFTRNYLWRRKHSGLPPTLELMGEMASMPFRLLFSPFNHLEVAYQADDDRTATWSILIGGGL